MEARLPSLHPLVIIQFLIPQRATPAQLEVVGRMVDEQPTSALLFDAREPHGTP